MLTETRKFEVLRISVSSSCGFACAYCAPKQSNGISSFEPPSHFLTLETLQRNLTLLTSRLDLKEVHLTGGEPSLHSELQTIIREIRKFEIPEIALTTNGFFRKELLEKWLDAGLSRINFSMDALSDHNFEKMSGKKLNPARLIENIEMARRIGLPVKINCTVLRGYNETEILPLLEWAGSRNIPIRYLELMKMGPLQSQHQELFVSAEEIRDQILQKHPFVAAETPSDSTANYFQTLEGYKFGTIANHTEPFCSGCNRLRMDSFGRIYGCLSDPRYYTLPEDELGINRSLDKAMQTKKKEFIGSEVSMKFIGG